MKKAGISQAGTKKMPPLRKLPPRKWQAQTHRLMSNRKRILRAKFASEALLQRALCLRRRQLPAISSKRSLEYIHARRLHLRHRLTAGVEHHRDEHPTRIIAAVDLVSSTS